MFLLDHLLLFRHLTSINIASLGISLDFRTPFRLFGVIHCTTVYLPVIQHTLSIYTFPVHAHSPQSLVILQNSIQNVQLVTGKIWFHLFYHILDVLHPCLCSLLETKGLQHVSLRTWKSHVWHVPGDDEFQNKKQLLMSSPTFPQCPCLLSDSGSLAHLAQST